uniref:Uncharacterized protein n=1 Tax=Arundo donax TaxID=35708 RepID=A0A0A9BKJ3_ARUDO
MEDQACGVADHNLIQRRRRPWFQGAPGGKP